MIKKKIYCLEAFVEGEKIMDLELDIKAIRFSLISRREDLFGLVVIKIKDDKYKHMRTVLDSRQLSHIFDLEHYKKCITRSDIIKILNKISNTDEFLFLASKQYYRQRAYIGDTIVCVREIKV